MSITEIYKYPTVKQVIFQVRFPNLFYLESKMGDFQLEIMKEFPHSKLLIRRDFVIGDGQVQKSEKELESGHKIWQFTSDKNYSLNVHTDSIDITSQHHKTYDIEGEDKFRDAISFVLDRFLKMTKIPVFNRIGLRYVDQCPLPKKTQAFMDKYFNSSFPKNRFKLKDTQAYVFNTVTKKGNYFMRYQEELRTFEDQHHSLIMDFDGFSGSVDSPKYLKVTDDLHKMVSSEFKNSIKDPFVNYMRTGKIS